MSVLVVTVKEKRDNSVHYSLKNWGAYVRQDFKDGPWENPSPASWQGQVTDRVTGEPPDPHYIDEDNAIRTQQAMIACMLRDMETAMLLTKHYRDGWDVPRLRKARNKFWRWL